MDPANYYITTLTTAFKNLAPIAVFLLGGYLLFIKGPFLLLRRSMREQKEKLGQEGTSATALTEKLSGEKVTASTKQGTTAKIAAPKSERKPGPTSHARGDSKREDRREAPRQKSGTRERAPEEVFEISSHAVLNASELKKRYFELLKQNHPDRVASMGPEFKKLAEKNTKEINRAYEALRKKAS